MSDVSPQPPAGSPPPLDDEGQFDVTLVLSAYASLQRQGERVQKVVADTQEFVKENAPVVQEKVVAGTKAAVAGAQDAAARAAETAKDVSEKVAKVARHASENVAKTAKEVRDRIVDRGEEGACFGSIRPSSPAMRRRAMLPRLPVRLACWCA